METPTIIDVEASGFGAGSYPIEIGFVLPDRTTTCFLIRPLDDWTHWDNAAEQIHGIQRESLDKRGRTVTDAAQLLNDQLAGRIVYTDGWSNDLSWLGLLFECSGIPQRFKLESLRAILDEQQIRHWHATKEQVQLELNLERHRASADAQILQMTFLRTSPGAAT